MPTLLVSLYLGDVAVDSARLEHLVRVLLRLITPRHHRVFVACHLEPHSRLLQPHHRDVGEALLPHRLEERHRDRVGLRSPLRTTTQCKYVLGSSGADALINIGVWMSQALRGIVAYTSLPQAGPVLPVLSETSATHRRHHHHQLLLFLLLLRTRPRQHLRPRARLLPPRGQRRPHLASALAPAAAAAALAASAAAAAQAQAPQRFYKGIQNKKVKNTLFKIYITLNVINLLINLTIKIFKNQKVIMFISPFGRGGVGAPPSVPWRRRQQPR